MLALLAETEVGAAHSGLQTVTVWGAGHELIVDQDV
jgi:hypothetical protein